MNGISALLKKPQKVFLPFLRTHGQKAAGLQEVQSHFTLSWMAPWVGTFQLGDLGVLSAVPRVLSSDPLHMAPIGAVRRQHQGRGDKDGIGLRA